MTKSKGYKSIPLTFNRKAVIASVSVSSRKNTIHALTDIDVSLPRKLISNHFEKTGEKLSFTAYIVACLAQTVEDHPHCNAFIKGNRLILLDDVTISVLVERELGPEKVPEPLGITGAQNKTFLEIHHEIRKAQESETGKLGGLAGMTWIRYIPAFLFRRFVKVADRNIKMAKRYGKVAITAVGMFSDNAVWFIPHGSATVLLTVGGISKKVIRDGDHFTEREHLCLTISFDHNIIDGSPAARFIKQLTTEIESGRLIQESIKS